MTQVDLGAAEPALGQHHGHGRRPGRGAGLGSLDQHVRQPWRQGQAGQGAAVRGEVALPVERLQALQEGPGLLEGGRRRRIEEGQLRGVFGPPAGEVQGEAGEVGLEDLRAAEGDQGAGLRLIPEPVADPGLGAPRPSPALVGGRPGHAHGLQADKAAGRIEPRHAGQPAVHHHPHALDGQAGLGDRGGQHHLAPPFRRGGDRARLLGEVQGPVERREIHRRVADTLGQQPLHPPDLPLSRQEHEEAAAFLGEGPGHRLGDLLVHRGAGVAAQVAVGDGEHPALALDDRGLVHQPGDGGGVQGR